MQKRGRCSLPVLTRPFADVLERILTYYQLSAAMPCIVVEHPMQNIDATTLQRRAEQIVEEVLRLLPGAG